jgi:tetratricopeptide (TPR) repeat protein
MYTTNNDKQAERALQKFEQVRYFFLRNSRNHQAPESRVRIIAFSSESEFKPYRMNGGNFAFYMQSRERDYIVMQDVEPEHLQAAAHEYTHLIIRHIKLDVPLWLEEGLADLYSSLEPKGQQALVGRPLPQYIYTLRSGAWVDLNTLISVDHDSPFYNRSDKMGIFYAESWEVTHMLALSPAYHDRFPDFLASLNGGASSAEAFHKVYGKSVQEVSKDAQLYLGRTSVPAAVFNITLQKSDLDPQVAALSEFQTGLALSELLATRPQTAGEARRRLLALEQANSQSPEVEESLGYLAWQENNTAEARRRFRLAVERGSTSSRMFYDDSNLEHMAGARGEAVIDLMTRAVELKPEDNDFRILLAQLYTENGLWSQALGAISSIHTLEPSQAFGFYMVNAYCHANLQDPAGARDYIAKATPFAKTPPDHSQIDQLKRFLDRSEQLPVMTSRAETEPERRTEDADLPRVHGQTKAFECGHQTFRLHILVGQREMVFAMDDPKNIVVRNVQHLEWSCGPLKPQDVTVIYKADASSKVDGAVKELVF